MTSGKEPASPSRHDGRHRLQAPTQALSRLLDLLGKTAIDDTQRRYLALCYEALASLATSVDELDVADIALDRRAQRAPSNEPRTPVLPGAQRVLVVDDDDANLLYARAILQEAGADVVTESDVERVVELIVRRGPFALALIDLQMPGIGGLGLLRQLQATAGASRTPYVVLSATSDPDVLQEAIDAGAVASILKPATPEMLAEALTRYAARPGADLVARRAAVVSAVEAGDRRTLALVVGAIRVGHPQLALHLEGRLARRELAGVLQDLDAAILVASTMSATQAITSPSTSARRLFGQTAAIERDRLDALVDVAVRDPDVGVPALREAVKTMAHRLAGSAATFGHPDVGDAARFIGGELHDTGDTGVTRLAFGLLFALAEVADAERAAGSSIR